jgi:hypothetical protein
VNAGGGNFAAATSHFTAQYYGYHLASGDFDADGRLDLAVAHYNSDRLTVLQGNSDGTFRTAQTYAPGGNPIALAVADFNADGRPDLASAGHNNSTVRVLTGNGRQLLMEDPASSGLRSGFGRGNLSVYSVDTDYWSFSGSAGDRLTIAAENPGSPNSSGLNYTVYRPDGVYLTNFFTDQFGRGQSSPVVLPASGTYFIGVTYNYGYEGEYRFRATIANPPVQSEAENNGGTSSATALSFTTAGSNRTATAGGFVQTVSDLDYFSLGTVNAGESIFLKNPKPRRSNILPNAAVYKKSKGLIVESGSGRAMDGVAQV